MTQKTFQGMNAQVSFSAGNQTANLPNTNSNPSTSSGQAILWGAAAAAMLGMTLAEWQKKREEEAARLAALIASNAGQEDEDEIPSDVLAKRRAKVIAKNQAKRNQEQAWENARTAQNTIAKNNNLAQAEAGMGKVKPATPYVAVSYIDKDEEKWLKGQKSQRATEKNTGRVKAIAMPSEQEGDNPFVGMVIGGGTKTKAQQLATQAVQTAWAQITQTAQAMPTITPIISTPTPILPNYQLYKSTGPLTKWEMENGGQMAHGAHLLKPYFSNFEFWSEGIEINGIPPWAGQLIELPIPMLYQNGQFGWYVENQGQLGAVNVPDTSVWINNKFSSTTEGAKPISQILEYTNNRIPFVCGDVPDWLYYMNGHNLETEFPEFSTQQYPTARWPRASYAWVNLFFNDAHLADPKFVDLRVIDTNTYRFTDKNLPELGDALVTQFGGDVMSTSPGDATHVVSVIEINGYGLDQVIVIEGNSSANSLTFTTLKQVIDREGGQMKYIVYGHPIIP